MRKPLLLLSMLVVFVTVYSLVLPAITLDEETANNAPGIVLNENTEETTVLNDEPTEKQSEELPEEGSDTTIIENNDTVVTTDPVVTIDNPVTPDTQETDDVLPVVESEYPAVKFSQVVNDSIIYVEAPEGAFKKGTIMEAEEVEDTSELEESINNDLKNSVVKKIKAIDIRFIYNDEEVEPEVPIKVSITSAFVENNDENALLMHIDDEGKTNEVKQNELKEEELNTISEEIKDVIDEHEEITEVNSDNTITFEADSFSVYAIVYVQTIKIKADGGTYNITVSYTDEAQIPEGSVLSAREIEPDTVEYNYYLTKSAEQLETTNENISFARFFDIEILKDGEKIEPAVPVDVDITFDKGLDLGDNQQFNVVHFIDEDNTEIIDDVDFNENKTQISYVQGSFSVTATVVTVDNSIDVSDDAGKVYMLLVKISENDSEKTYVILNNGTLEEYSDIDQQQNYIFDTPMLWTYENNSGVGATHLFHNADAVAFDYSDRATDFYRRYLDPSTECGLTQETNGNAEVRDGVRYYQVTLNEDNTGVDNRMSALYETNLLIENISKETTSGNEYDYSKIKKRDTNYYLGVTKNSEGQLIIKGKANSDDAAHIVLAEAKNVPEKPSDDDNSLWKKRHIVNHIDIAIIGNAELSVPLKIGSYYYENSDNELVHFNQEENIDLKLVNDQVSITKDDIKRGVIEAFKWSSDGNSKIYLNDAFIVTGYSANRNTEISADQVRIEGVFKVADLAETSEPDSSTTKGNRLANKIYYTVTTEIPVTFEYRDSYGRKIYDSNKEEMKITANVNFSASFSYYDWNGTLEITLKDGSKKTITKKSGKDFEGDLPLPNKDDVESIVKTLGKGSNECPPLQPSGAWSDYGNFIDWQEGGIPSAPNTGMDFVLGGDTGIPDSNTVAINIQKNIVDLQGNLIKPNKTIKTEFNINYKKNTITTDSESQYLINDANEVAYLNVNNYTSDFTNSEYTRLHTKEINVGSSDPTKSSGTAMIYDYDVVPGMYYIEEIKNDDFPYFIRDVDGNIWQYNGTRIYTEYVWRHNDYPDNSWHYSKEYTPSSTSLYSVGEVVGDYVTPRRDNYEPEALRNAFLNFRVDNIYEPKTYSVNLSKIEQINNNSSTIKPLTGAEFNFGPCILSDDKTSYAWEEGYPAKLTSTSSLFNLGNLKSGTYCLLETKTPDGYNLLTKTIIITVDSKLEGVSEKSPVSWHYLGEAENVHYVNIDEDDIYLFNVENTPGVELPMTGGSGPEYICTIGGLMMLVSGIMIIRRRYLA